MQDITRRQFLATVGGSAVALSAVSGTVAADHFDHQPEHVRLTFDQAMLERYQPKFVMADASREKLIGLYGWVASSPEYEYDICVYGASYTHQEGLSPISAALYAPLSDEHYGDHEWYYVAVNKAGSVEKVVYDQFHWTAGKRAASMITLDDTHPVVRVIKPWHFYNHSGVTSDQGELVRVQDLTTAFDGWLDNGLEDSLAPGTVVDPARMLPGGRSHWWRSTFAGVSFLANYANAMAAAGVLGADKTE